MGANGDYLDESDYAETSKTQQLAELQASKEALLTLLDKEELLRQNVVKKHNSKHQELVLCCVFSCFCCLCMFLFTFISNPALKIFKLVLIIVMLLASLFFLILAVRIYPSTLKYTYKKAENKKSVLYEEIISESRKRSQDISDKLKAINDQLDEISEDIMKNTVDFEKSQT